MAPELSLLDSGPGPELSQEQREQQRLVDEVFTHKFGRPLIVIGSGVSTDQVPDMRAIFRYLRAKIDQKLTVAQAHSDDSVEVKILHETSELAKSLASGLRHRPLAARLFGELQDSAVTAVQEVWTTFCVDFLNGEIEENRQPILSLLPNKSHEALASLYEVSNILVLSFNFDGLTYWALRAHFKEKPDRIFILDDRAKINEFYGRKPGENPDWAVWKIRGDIFYAVCRQSGCPSRDVASPIYKLGPRQPESSKNAQQLLDCPECGTQRSLQISFPGLEKKERDTDAILNQIWRYVAPTLSGICFAGLSGIWDEAVVKSLLALAAQRGIPVLDVRPLPPEPDPDDQYINLLANASHLPVRYSRISSKAESFFLNATNIHSALHAETVSTSLPTEDLPADELWDQAPEFSVAGWNTGLPVPSRSTDLAYHIANHADVRQLRLYSQLGLKNYWWGRNSFTRHNRYLHSIGTLRVAATWYQQLGSSIRRHVRMARSGVCDRERHLLAIAALLHDYGHLAFSHLCEQIFRDLNWAPSFGRPYNHLEVGVEKITKLLSEGQIHAQHDKVYSIRSQLAEIGYEANDVVRLIRGGTGIGYLDAIVNSPVDADKIDYIFRDSIELNLGVRLPPRDGWLHEFLEDQDVSPEGLIRLNRRSALRMLELLETRRALYQDFYLSPWIRVIEALAANVITKYLIIETSLEMMNRLWDSTLTDPHPDWGALKLSIASERLEKLYAEVLENHESDKALEQPLLVRIINLLEGDLHGGKFDQGFKDFLSRAKELFHEFEREGSNRGNGEVLRSLYQKIHLAGPFRVPHHQRSDLESVIREVQLLYPDKVLFATSSMPQFLSTSEDRAYGGRPVGECILVPAGNPATWNMKSEARVPLHHDRFRDFESRYTEVVLVDPWEGARLSGRYVLDVFKRRCRSSGIDLSE